jgi:prolyl 4-hydroxylase
MRQPCFRALLAWTAVRLCRAGSPDASPPKPPIHACKVRQTGYHIIEQEECGLLIWPESNALAQPLDVQFSSSWSGFSCSIPSFTEIQTVVEKKLEIRPRNAYEQPVRYFTSQGKVLNNDDDWAQATLDGPVFVIEGGQFQWPPVRVGFKQKVEGLSVGGRQIELETMALKPPVFSIKHLTTPEESDQLVQYAMPKFEQSSVGKKSNYRPKHNETKLIQEFEDRAAFLTRIPRSHQEALQILEYGQGGFYRAHDDASRMEIYSQNRSHILRHHYGYFDRMITLFWYLNDVPKGGATNFPMADTPVSPRPNDKCEQGLRVYPQKGSAVMWYNLHAGGVASKYALNAVCAVEEGVAHGVRAWVYNKPVATPPAEFDGNHKRWLQIRAGSSDRPDAEPKGQKKKKKQPGAKEGGKDVAAESNQDTLERKVSFQNDLGRTVDIYWVSPEGQEALMMNLEPGFTSGMNTYVGHTFIAKSQQGIEAKVKISGSKEDQTLIIGDPAHAEL